MHLEESEITMSYAPSSSVPKRTGPVTMIVAGVLAMILGPLVGIIMSVSNLLGTVDIQDFAGTQQISNGASADLTANSEWMVVADAGAGGYSCDITGTSGERVDTRSREGIVLFTSTTPGMYQISCEPSGGTLVVMPAGNLDEIIANAPGAVSSVAIGFAVGGLGLVALVGGIVWLIRVNRARRAAGGGYGGYGPGGYGPGGSGPAGYGYGQPPQQWGQGYPPPGQQPPAGPPPQYGQNLNEPPRYGERINPQDPTASS